jgi:hypothetical protein
LCLPVQTKTNRPRRLRFAGFSEARRAALTHAFLQLGTAFLRCARWEVTLL